MSTIPLECLLFVLLSCLIAIPFAAWLNTRDRKILEEDHKRESEWFDDPGI